MVRYSQKFCVSVGMQELCQNNFEHNELEI